MSDAERKEIRSTTIIGDPATESTGLHTRVTTPTGNVGFIDSDMALSLRGELPNLTPKPTE